MRIERLAPAKINLFLHVGPLGADGYHPISSLMTFADVGDTVRLESADALSFESVGEFGDGLGGADNLVVLARDAMMAAFDGPWPPFGLVLDKRLPVAAGIGGGSSDAAATINLMCDAFDLRGPRLAMRPDWSQPVRVDATPFRPRRGEADEVIGEIARQLGADVTACLGEMPVLASGRGDECEWPLVFPEVDAVLVNPLKPSATGEVYRAFDDAGAGAAADEPNWPDTIETPQALAGFLATCRNDLEAPAISLQPVIAQVLAALRNRPETLFARMSGSGATCFALCANANDARDLALAIGDARRDWWVQRCRLTGFGP